MANPNTRTRKPPHDAVLIIRINEALRERFARQAFLRNMSMSEAVRSAMEEWMGGEDASMVRNIDNPT